MNKAAGLGERMGDSSGRKAYLDQTYGSGVNRNYTEGEKSLDNYLISNTPGSREALEGNVSDAKALRGEFDALNNRLDAYQNQKKAETATTRSDTRTAIGLDEAGNIDKEGTIQKYVDTISPRIEDRKRTAVNDTSALRKSLQGKTGVSGIDKETAKLMTGYDPTKFPGTAYRGNLTVPGINGLTEFPGNFYGVNPSDYVNDINPGNINFSSVISKPESEKLGAYLNLADKPNTYISDPTSVGKYSEGPIVDFKTPEFLSSVVNKSNQFQGDLDTILNKYKEILSPSHKGALWDTDRKNLQNEINAVRKRYGLNIL
jgi:hypothetical protein